MFGSRARAGQLHFCAHVTLDAGARLRDIGKRDVTAANFRHEARHKLARLFFDGVDVMVIRQRLVDDQQVELFLVRDCEVGGRQQPLGSVPKVEIQLGFFSRCERRGIVELQAPRFAGGRQIAVLMGGMVVMTVARMTGMPLANRDGAKRRDGRADGDDCNKFRFHAQSRRSRIADLTDLSDSSNRRKQNAPPVLEPGGASRCGIV
jgi:hypothetical protein